MNHTITIQHPMTGDTYLLEAVDLGDGEIFIGATRNSVTEVHARYAGAAIGTDAALLEAYSAADADMARILRGA
jgi:hypothetical protein